MGRIWMAEKLLHFLGRTDSTESVCWYYFNHSFTHIHPNDFDVIVFRGFPAPCLEREHSSFKFIFHDSLISPHINIGHVDTASLKYYKPGVHKSRAPSRHCECVLLQGAYKLSEYFAKTYFHKHWTEIHDVTTNWKMNVCSSISYHDVQIAVGTRVEPPQNYYIAQIPEHTDYARSVAANSLQHWFTLSLEMTIAIIGPFQMLRSPSVIDTNFTILWHFILKLWHNEILR
jgi:hypothetical protein